jgi:hypothetical protein
MALLSKMCMATHNCHNLNHLNVLMLLENHEFPTILKEA